MKILLFLAPVLISSAIYLTEAQPAPPEPEHPQHAKGPHDDEKPPRGTEPHHKPEDHHGPEHHGSHHPPKNSSLRIQHELQRIVNATNRESVSILSSVRSAVEDAAQNYVDLLNSAESNINEQLEPLGDSASELKSRVTSDVANTVASIQNEAKNISDHVDGIIDHINKLDDAENKVNEIADAIEKTPHGARCWDENKGELVKNLRNASRAIRSGVNESLSVLDTRVDEASQHAESQQEAFAYVVQTIQDNNPEDVNAFFEENFGSDYAAVVSAIKNQTVSSLDNAWNSVQNVLQSSVTTTLSQLSTLSETVRNCVNDA